MQIFVPCEESQVVTEAFRARGHEAYSCDIMDCSGGHPEWHIKGDCTPLLNGHCTFATMDGQTHTIDGRWDMILAFPPCTHLAVSGARHFEKKREDGRQRDGLRFFCQFLNADCERIAVENPVNIINGEYVRKWFPDIAEEFGLPIKPTQTIQPYQFGHPTKKTTCLWLKGLPPLRPTNVVEPELVTHNKRDGGGSNIWKRSRHLHRHRRHTHRMERSQDCCYPLTHFQRSRPCNGRTVGLNGKVR